RLARAVGPDHADDLARRDVERKLLDRKGSRSPLRRRWIREAHSAELCQHQRVGLLEARLRGAGVWEGSFDHAARVRCSAAAGLHLGARLPSPRWRERVSSTPPTPRRLTAAVSQLDW